MPTDVDDYIANITDEIQPIAEKVREIIIDGLPDADEAIMWSRPTYKVDSKHVCYFTAARTHLTLGFTHGHTLTDPDGLLEGEGKQMPTSSSAASKTSTKTSCAAGCGKPAN